LLTDPVTEVFTVVGPGEAVSSDAPDAHSLEVHLRPGVMDPVAESTLAELRAEGWPVASVRTARRYVLYGSLTEPDALERIGRVLANDCIERVVVGTAGVQPAPRPPVYTFQRREVRLRDLDAAALVALSRSAHLFLSLREMRAIQEHYRACGREPTDLELETLAQTWSEHCVHKTLRSAVVYRGAAFPDPSGSACRTDSPPVVERRYANLLKETIVRATQELMAAGRGPQCLSVFQDNAGVIAFDDDFGIAFKVETHNHPSAIEPYGGAATGIGGVIRDVIGCGLGAKPIANTDVFCVAPGDWPHWLPKGVLHPRRVLRGVVRGVADYGNRMGIPTVNGAVYFDPRYLGNPLVYCGCVGLLPRGLVRKAARPGDRIVLVGGRTGRDGIHGATFSSAELTDRHADEFAHAVQIGNAITEKRFLDALLQARDAPGGCLYNAITDCGAGGLSSAVGEMGAAVGALVDLEKVPLKYAGLRYDEIWISEAQERMVVAVPPENLERFCAIMRAEEVEVTVIGTFGAPATRGPDGPRLVVCYAGQVVGDLDMRFLHDGWPRSERQAEWFPEELPATKPDAVAPEDSGTRLLRSLRRPVTASKEWIVRQYDHEVQGGSVVKPLLGPGRGPGDAAVLRPRLSSSRGIAIACGLSPHVADVDPYWMAAAAIDEAVRNSVCVGGDPRQTALLDNFCWGRSDDARQLGALVRACQACYDWATAYGTPFISGKDSLNNEFALDVADVEPLLALLTERARPPHDALEHWRRVVPHLVVQVRKQQRLAIPPTLLISAVSIIADVRACVTPDLKNSGAALLLVGCLPLIGFSPYQAAAVHRAVADLIGDGLVSACHDVSDSGWLPALAEMAVAGDRGATLTDLPASCPPAFDELAAGYLIETPNPSVVAGRLAAAGVSCLHLAAVRDDKRLVGPDWDVDIQRLREAWSGGC